MVSWMWTCMASWMCPVHAVVGVSPWRCAAAPQEMLCIVYAVWYYALRHAVLCFEYCMTRYDVVYTMILYNTVYCMILCAAMCCYIKQYYLVFCCIKLYSILYDAV